MVSFPSARASGLGTRGRIGIAFSLLAMTLFALIATLSGIAARRAGELASTTLLQQLATGIAQQLDADMAERYRDIEGLSGLETTLDLQMTPPNWRGVLERMQRSMTDYSWIGVTDATGTVLAATGGLLEGRDVHERPWFQRGRETAVVLDVHEAKLLGSLLPPGLSGEPQRFVDVAAPLRRNGRVFGVIGAHLSWDWAEQRRRKALSAIDPAMKVDVTIVDPGGSAVLGPIDTGSDRSYLRVTRSSQPDGTYPGMSWTVIARQPIETAFSGATRLQRRLWTFAVAGGVLFGVVGWWLAGRLTEPLRALARRARTMSPAGIGGESHDVVAQLAASIGSLIDDLRTREQELEAINRNLESLVQQRTASYEQANEDLRSFSRSVSHDLRGPLGQISMLLNGVMRGRDPGMSAHTRMKLEVAAAECERLRDLTTELLTLAMVQQSALEVEAVDTRRLVADALQALGMDPATRRATIDVGELAPSRGDPTLLRQVWSNLLSNAIKYSSKVDQPQIKISGVQTETEAIFAVEDNGAGFDPAYAARLFGVFQRLHSAAEFPGVGVGLSIVKRVVQRHGGRVWAESEPGRGACFRFALPRVDADGAGQATSAAREAAA